MTKEEYWKLLEEQDLVQIYYNYWLEHKKPDYANITLEDFRELFNIFLQAANGKGVHTPEGVKGIESNHIKDKVIGYYAQKFE
jgi:hypothetical protein